MQQDIRLRLAAVCRRRPRQLTTYSKMSIAKHKIARVNSPLGWSSPVFSSLFMIFILRDYLCLITCL